MVVDISTPIRTVFEQETGKAFVISKKEILAGAMLTYPSWDYVCWLENKVSLHLT